MQRKLLHILIALLFLFISSILVDGGRTFILVGNNVSVHLDSGNHNDLEVPHQHKHIISVDDERLLNLIIYNLSSPANSLIQVSYKNILKPADYSVAIWQPPKSK